jgi:hypothetical protein
MTIRDWTIEDIQIWLWVGRLGRERAAAARAINVPDTVTFLLSQSAVQDQRDAELMRLCQEHRFPCHGAPWTQEMTCGYDADGEPIHSGGNLRRRHLYSP